MKSVPDSGPIWSAWANGKALVGPNKPHSRITVQPGWWLNTTDHAGARPPAKLPIRYFQRADNSQQEIEIPGVRSIDVDYDVDQDVATLSVQLVNNRFDPDYGSSEWQNSNGDFGRPGYLTSDRGSVSNRWGYVPNEWSGLLVRNALIRSWEGYGGQDKTLEQAIADGNLVLTGIWLVDDVPIKTGQGFELQARNTGKLLVDQYLYPPLIPAGDYPMSRARFFYSSTTLTTAQVIYGTNGLPNSKYRILRIERSLAGGYWLVGTDGGVFTYGPAHFQGSIDSIGLTITPGTYPSEGVTGISRSHTGDGYWLVTDTGAVYSFGDAAYHGGAGLSDPPAHPVIAIETAGTRDGYWLIGDDGGVFSFGDVDFYGSLPPLVAGAKIVDGASTPDGLGYWLVDKFGHVYSYGNANYFGGITGALGAPIVAIASSPTGNGYVMTGKDGGVFSFGDAGFYGSIPGLIPAITLNDPVCDIVLTESGHGYWLAAEDGGVFAFGDAVFYGSLPQPDTITTTTTTDGNYTDYCCDEETEILTRRGWLGLDAVRPGDETLAIDPETGESAWSRIDAVNVFAARRRAMWSMESETHSSLTTFNHRWLVESQDGKRRWTTSMLLNSSDRILTAAPRSDLPVAPTLKDHLVELVAWWYTEGSFSSVRGPVRGPRRRGGQISQSTVVNLPFADRIRSCLLSLYGPPTPMKRGRTVDQSEVDEIYRMRSEGASIAHIERTTGVDHRTIVIWLKNPPPTGPRWNEDDSRESGVTLFNLSVDIVEELCRYAPDKVPTTEFLLSLTGPQLEMFIQTSLDADNAGRRPSADGFAQVDRRRSESFEMACVLSGRATSGRVVPVRGYRPMWHVAPLRHRRIGPIAAAKKPGRRNGRGSAECKEVTYSGRVWCPSLTRGNWLARRRGKVYFTGNTDIIKDLALYAGFNLYDGGATDDVYGVVETTGIYAPDQAGNVLDATFFDKLPVIDPMTKIKEVVGYILTVGDEGELHFHSPNFWQSGNFLPDHTHTDTVPVIDERVQLTSYQVNTPDKDLRSEIIISSEDPDLGIAGTVTTSFTPSTARELRGLVRPAMWVNEAFSDSATQQTMAELIALHIYFKSRLGTVTCMGNPMIQPDDQVQILERETFETNTHYVRRIHRTHDRKAGTYSMSLTTNVLSPPGSWAVVKPTGTPEGSIVVRRP